MELKSTLRLTREILTETSFTAMTKVLLIKVSKKWQKGVVNFGLVLLVLNSVPSDQRVRKIASWISKSRVLMVETNKGKKSLAVLPSSRALKKEKCLKHSPWLKSETHVNYKHADHEKRQIYKMDIEFLQVAKNCPLWTKTGTLWDKLIPTNNMTNQSLRGKKKKSTLTINWIFSLELSEFTSTLSSKNFKFC